MSENNISLQATVIIPVWNGRNDLPACLTALMKQTGVTFEVIAVDDESSDGSAEFISTHFPQVRLLRTHTNTGFSAACNVGLRHATGDVLVLLNQDTEVKSGWLAALTNTLRSDKQIGIAGSKALYADGTLQHVGGQVNVLGNGVHIASKEKDRGQYEERVDADYVTGAALAITRSAYQKVGGLDERFDRAYYEDVDLCYRVRDAGYRVVYEPTSVLVHNEHSLVVDSNLESETRLQSNRLRFVFKNWDPQKLNDEFIPMEKEWIELLDPQQPKLVNAMRKAYMRLMMSAADLSHYRHRQFGHQTNVFEVAQAFWLHLAEQEHLRPLTSISQSAQNQDSLITLLESNSLLLAAQVDAIRAIHPIRTQPFRSEIPFIGPLIAGFRHRWNQVATEWFVVPLLQKQNNVNANVLDALDNVLQTLETVSQVHQLEARLTTEYISELTWQISRLNKEIKEQKEQHG